MYGVILRLCGSESTGPSVSCKYVFYCVFAHLPLICNCEAASSDHRKSLGIGPRATALRTDVERQLAGIVGPAAPVASPRAPQKPLSFRRGAGGEVLLPQAAQSPFRSSGPLQFVLFQLERVAEGRVRPTPLSLGSGVRREVLQDGKLSLVCAPFSVPALGIRCSLFGAPVTVSS